MKKRWLSILALALTAVGCCAFGACKGADVQGLVYEKIGGKDEYRVTNTFMESVITNITIPDTYLGLPVTEIGAHAFEGKTYIKSVKIGDNVKEIAPNAFEGCDGLTSVVIPDSVRKMRRRM